ncbi:hypothetical protein VTN49DRAFT_5722 [Thermomyces lanuginosus]|uniref:uncharacterized protein n=1 Tax=Thermomyces lanuginosus TaxID=5541 RepID=UPI0037421DAB
MDDEAKTGPFKPTVLSEDGLRSGARQAKAVTGEIACQVRQEVLRSSMKPYSAYLDKHSCAKRYCNHPAVVDLI